MHIRLFIFCVFMVVSTPVWADDSAPTDDTNKPVLGNVLVPSGSAHKPAQAATPAPAPTPKTDAVAAPAAEAPHFSLSDFWKRTSPPATDAGYIPPAVQQKMIERETQFIAKMQSNLSALQQIQSQSAYAVQTQQQAFIAKQAVLQSSGQNQNSSSQQGSSSVPYPAAQQQNSGQPTPDQAQDQAQIQQVSDIYAGVQSYAQQTMSPINDAIQKSQRRLTILQSGPLTASDMLKLYQN